MAEDSRPRRTTVSPPRHRDVLAVRMSVDTLVKMEGWTLGIGDSTCGGSRHVFLHPTANADAGDIEITARCSPGQREFRWELRRASK
jgi:hypothetical protein